MDVPLEKLKTELYALLEGKDLSVMTKKMARKMLEKRLGLAENALKPRKPEITELLTDYAANQAQKESAGTQKSRKRSSKAASDGPSKKKSKAESKAEVKKVPTHSCETRTGEKAPRNLKERQSDLLTTSEFMAKAQDVKLEIFGNKLTGKPRSFSSDNKGWYLGGKILVPIGDEVLWCQASINISVLGSKEWAD